MKNQKEECMKKVLLVLLAVVVLSAGTAFAGQKKTGLNLDAFVGLATEPASGLGNTFGLGVGATLDLAALGAGGSGSADDVKLRADISYFNWDENFYEFRRIPVFAGARYFFVPAGKGSSVSVYGEGGLELSFDKVDVEICFGIPPFIPVTCSTASEDEVNLGLTLGGGLEVPVADNVYIGANLRLHLISDAYFTLLGSIGFSLD
jgi:opacity protein-like surface antigen